jgi:hypothetical protein
MRYLRVGTAFRSRRRTMTSKTVYYVAQHIVAFMDEVIAVAHKDHRAVPRTFPITVNPFHMPGQQQIGSLRLPLLGNGFVTAIFRDEEGDL